MEKLGISPGLLLVFTANFAIIFVVLRAWVYKPMTKMLDERRKKVAQGLEDARVAADARANAEEAASRIISESQSKAGEILKDATARADAMQKDWEAEARKNIENERAAALATAEEERLRQLSEMRGDVSAIAIAAAQKLIGEALDEKRQHALLTEFFSGVKGSKVTLLEDKQLSGSSAEITSALPLTPDEQTQVKQQLLGQLGAAASIAFKVDPAILGGLIIRVGDQVVDGSVSGQLNNLQRALI